MFSKRHFLFWDRKLSQVCGKSVKSQDDENEEDYKCFLNLCFFNASPSAPGWFVYPPGKSAKIGLENPQTTGRYLSGTHCKLYKFNNNKICRPAHMNGEVSTTNEKSTMGPKFVRSVTFKL